MRSRRRSRRLEVNAEINVVNLIDVMLLLMVIFMLTAPMMQGGVDVSLPRADVRPMEAKRGLIVTVARDETIAVGETRVTFEEFRSSFAALAGDQGRNGLYLRADEAVPYGTIMQVIAIMKNANIGEVGLVAEPEQIR